MKVIVEADGGSRGNPGPAGYGSVVWSADHEHGAGREQAGDRPRHQQRRRVPRADRRSGGGGRSWAPPRSTVSMDSKLVVEQMSGRWKVKHPDLLPLHQQAKALAPRFDHISYAWIPRAKNSHADRLANEAMDAAAELDAERRQTASRRTASSPAGWTGARGAPTRFLLLRHGQTELSTQRRYSGRGNPALTDVGRRQAEAAAQYLGAARRYRGGDHVAAAARLRHRRGGGQGAWARRHRRRRPDRDGLRRVGGPDVRRGRRA